MPSANDYKRVILDSQWGEDGILAHLLGVMGEGSRLVIEFGAANGRFCSNTTPFRLQGFRALLIEADPALFSELAGQAGIEPSTTAINAKVDNIDDFTTEVADLISIDVDGDDYYIFERMETRHRIVCIEHNPTVPPHLYMVGPEGTPTGASARSLVDLAFIKGYRLVAATKSNLIFVRGEDMASLVGYESDLETLFDRSCLNYLVTDYRGNYDIAGRLPYGMAQRKDFGLT